jgi:hypothetical protein
MSLNEKALKHLSEESIEALSLFYMGASTITEAFQQKVQDNSLTLEDAKAMLLLIATGARITTDALVPDALSYKKEQMGSSYMN